MQIKKLSVIFLKFILGLIVFLIVGQVLVEVWVKPWANGLPPTPQERYEAKVHQPLIRQ